MVAVCVAPAAVSALLFVAFLIMSDSACSRRLLTYVYMLITITVMLLGIWILIYFEGIYSGGDNVPTELGKIPDNPQ